MKYSIKDFVKTMWPNPQFPADLVTFIKEILNVKLQWLIVNSAINAEIFAISKINHYDFRLKGKP